MKNSKIYIIALLSSLVTFSQFSCSNFDEINTNPEATTEATASLLCTNNILAVTKFGGDPKAFISESAFSKYVGYANEGQMGTQYNQIGSGSFGAMTVLPNIDKMIEYAEGTDMESSYRGVGKFVRARLFYDLTMRMGDIPYSETNQSDKDNFTPVYDSQEDVLLGVLDELKEADSYFAEGKKFNGDPTSYNGDPDKWRRATNAFALKILISLSNKVENSKINIKERFAEIVEQNYLLQSTTGYWGLNFSVQNKHPLYGPTYDWRSHTLPSSLLVNDLKKLKDRRLFYYAEPSSKQLNSGKKENEYEAYVGVDVDMVYSEMNQKHAAGEYSSINKRYQMEVASEPRMFITFAEQQLILAEARLLEWFNNGIFAEDFYKSGVRNAFADINSFADKKYGHGVVIDNSYIEGDYLNGTAKFASTLDGRLKQIWLQRYILNYLRDPVTAYFEYRRTGYPEFPVNPNTNLNPNPNFKDKIPVRWTYPGNESNDNQKNLEEALKRQYDGYDDVNRIMWILKD